MLNAISLFPIGSLVELSSGETAKVIHSNGEANTRPVVRVLFGPEGRPTASPVTLNLVEHEDISINSSLENRSHVDVNDGF